MAAVEYNRDDKGAQTVTVDGTPLQSVSAITFTASVHDRDTVEIELRPRKGFAYRTPSASVTLTPVALPGMRLIEHTYKLIEGSTLRSWTAEEDTYPPKIRDRYGLRFWFDVLVISLSWDAGDAVLDRVTIGWPIRVVTALAIASVIGAYIAWRSGHKR